MTSKDETLQVILDFVVQEYVEDGADVEIGPDTPLISSGIVDSFSMVSLKSFLERKFKISIPDSKATAEAFDTVSSIAALVERCS